MRISFELAAEFRDDAGQRCEPPPASRGTSAGNPVRRPKEPRAITLDHQKLMTLIDNEKFYSSIINSKVGDVTQAAIVKDLQMHPARNAIVHVDMQRVLRDREDPHPHPDPLQGRGCLAGREGAGRRGVAPHRRRGNLLPAEGPARVHRARSVADEPERDEASVRPAAAGGRHDSRASPRPQCRRSCRSTRRVRKSRNRPPKSLPRRLPKAPLLLRPKVRPPVRRPAMRRLPCRGCQGAAAAPAKKEGGKK